MTVDDDEFRRLQAAFDKIVEERSPGCLAFAAMFLTASITFWPASRTPSATRTEIDVTFRSSRTRDRAVENEPDNRPFLRLGLRLACLWRRRFQAMP